MHTTSLGRARYSSGLYRQSSVRPDYVLSSTGLCPSRQYRTQHRHQHGYHHHHHRQHHHYHHGQHTPQQLAQANEHRLGLFPLSRTLVVLIETMAGSADAAWATCKPGGAPQPAEERWAEDDKKYTWQEFKKCYGNEASKYWNAAQKVTPSASSHADDAAQLAVNLPMAAAQQMTTAGDGAPQLVANPSVPADAGRPICTYEQLRELSPTPGMGGKIACTKQRELRQLCLDTSTWEIDITSTWPEWRAVLRALPPGQQQLIIGDGIVQVKFRLLEDVQDPNYAKRRNDPGARHVFEIVRIDTSAVHLHYHKSGRLADPQIIRPRGIAQQTTGGASQPTAPVDGDSPSQPGIGRREAVMALEQLLYNCWGQEAGAVDITAEEAFQWKRFVQNTMEHRQIFAMPLQTVFALRTEQDGPVMLAFCTHGPNWTLLKVTQEYYKDTHRPALDEQEGDWRAEHLFREPAKVGPNGMRLE